MRFELYNGGRKVLVEVTRADEDFGVAFDGKQFSVRLTPSQAGDAIIATVEGRELIVTLDEETESTLQLTVGGRVVTLRRAQAQLESGLPSHVEASPTMAEQNALLSPLFGKVISVDVKVGDSVDSGQSLLVLEAMKMESVIRADGKHKIKEVFVKEGDGVNKSQVLISYA